MEKVKVQIDGMSFYVVGDEEADYIRGLAKELNEMYDKTNRSNARLNQVQAQVLTSLNLLDQFKKLEVKLEEVKNSSRDAQMASEKESKIEELSNSLSKAQSKYEELKKQLDQIKEEKTGIEKESEEIKKSLREREEEIAELKSFKALAEKKEEELSEKNYQSQLTITDLNKEISILRGEA